MVGARALNLLHLLQCELRARCRGRAGGAVPHATTAPTTALCLGGGGPGRGGGGGPAGHPGGTRSTGSGGL